MSDRLFEGLRTTLTDPRSGARMVLGWRLGWSQIGLILAVGVTLTLLVTSIDIALLGERIEGEAPFLLSPSIVGLLVASVVVQGGLILWIGRAFGGHGNAPGVALAVTWANLAQSVLMGIADFVGLLLPGGIVTILFIAAALWSLWILACFVAAVHGFDSPGKVLAAIFGFAIGLTVLMFILLTAAGVSPPGS
jgi:hypothetical protein